MQDVHFCTGELGAGHVGQMRQNESRMNTVLVVFFEASLKCRKFVPLHHCLNVESHRTWKRIVAQFIWKSCFSAGFCSSSPDSIIFCIKEDHFSKWLFDSVKSLMCLPLNCKQISGYLGILSWVVQTTSWKQLKKAKQILNTNSVLLSTFYLQI